MTQKAFSILAGLGVLAGLQAAVHTQQPRSLVGPVYRAELLRKVADLVESRFVLAEKAKEFADAFRANYRTSNICRGI